MSFSVKEGVDLTEVHPEMVTAWPTIMQCYVKRGLSCTLTSGRDGEHMVGSFHYTWPMKANDFRTWADEQGTQLPLEEKEALAQDIRDNLGDRFQVLVKKTHLHIELDPFPF